MHRRVFTQFFHERSSAKHEQVQLRTNRELLRALLAEPGELATLEPEVAGVGGHSDAAR